MNLRSVRSASSSAVLSERVVNPLGPADPARPGKTHESFGLLPPVDAVFLRMQPGRSPALAARHAADLAVATPYPQQLRAHTEQASDVMGRGHVVRMLRLGLIEHSQRLRTNLDRVLPIRRFPFLLEQRNGSQADTRLAHIGQADPETTKSDSPDRPSLCAADALDAEAVVDDEYGGQ